ncbi:MAG: aminotransferase [Candidatus Poribacteria bacterium]|nr:aminotransferase [Candidatus Poribacteria bacterium]
MATSQRDLSLEEYRSIDRDHIWHPIFQHQALENTDLIVIKEAHGTTITDSEGNQYLDALSGLWNVNVGYGREEIADAVYEQMRQLSYYPLSQINVPAALLADKLAELLPGDLQHVYFSNSGSEANETSIKIARQYGRQKFPGQNRHKIIARYRGYHGFTYGAMSATGQTQRRKVFEPLVPGFLHAHPPYCYRCPLGKNYPACDVSCADEIEQIVQWEGVDTVIGVIAEPIIGGGGVIVPPDDYLPKLREICDRYGLLLILDEVITGFGRTGVPFACEHWGVQPDIISLAKGLTSGYLPLGASVVTPEVFDVFRGAPDDYLEFAQVATYGGHPVTCAAGLANLKILTEERLWENSAQVGSYLLEKLKVLSDLPIVGDIRGKGLMIGVELVNPDQSSLDTATTNIVVGMMRDRGILIGKVSHTMDEPENTIFIAPPLIVTSAEADRIFASLRDVLSNLKL